MPKLILDQVLVETATISVLQFRAEGGADLPPYSAGAHIDFDLGAAGQRSYSLIDWPGDMRADRYTVAVQREERGEGGSKAMHALEVGQTVSASYPINDFPLSEIDAPILLLAGGIGVTPIIAMATALAAQGREFVFHYTGRSEEEMAFTTPLKTSFPTQLVLHFDDTNPIDLPAVMAAQPAATELYICGPKGMIDAARAAAVSAGINEGAIHIELFTSPEPEAGDTSFEVEVSSTGKVYVIPAGKTIIDVLEADGVDLMYDCQRGDCGICQTDVIDGIPDHRDVVLSADERASGKIMQICVSRAKSLRLVLDL